ncbi:MAG TPA: DUF3566 domain-containing protein [Egibacteraceae bacterium]|nr:DUF3566 domain-containing protein [Egibacteraceae bacterium]
MRPSAPEGRGRADGEPSTVPRSAARPGEATEVIERRPNPRSPSAGAAVASTAPAAPSPPASPARQARPATAGQPVRRTTRRRSTVRKVDPWSVLKLSLLFYFCALLVVMLALTVFWAVVNQLGLVDHLLDFLAELQLVIEIRGGMIARAVFLIGLLNVVLWSGINVFLAFLYNLIADLVGGLRLTLVEEE